MVSPGITAAVDGDAPMQCVPGSREGAEIRSSGTLLAGKERTETYRRRSATSVRRRACHRSCCGRGQNRTPWRRVTTFSHSSTRHHRRRTTASGSRTFPKPRSSTAHLPPIWGWVAHAVASAPRHALAVGRATGMVGCRTFPAPDPGRGDASGAREERGAPTPARLRCYALSC